jgi:exodeoxyribonuclease III
VTRKLLRAIRPRGIIMAKSKTLRIATFNANSVRTRLPIILEWLGSHKPDVLCLQETKVTDDVFPKDAFTAAGYPVVFHGQKSYSGVAIATIDEPADVAFGFDKNEEGDECRLARITYRGWSIINTYVPQGQELDSPVYQYKLQWFARLRELFAAHYSVKKLLVWVGDLNVAPEEIDLHNPKGNKNHVCFHESVRTAFKKVVEWGLVDVFRKHHPEPEQYTFWDYRFPTALTRNIGWRVDHILATPPAAEKSVDCRIDKEPRLKEKPSDHTFVFADFKV